MSKEQDFTPERWIGAYINALAAMSFFVDLETDLIVDNVDHDPKPVCIQYAFNGDEVEIVSYELDRERFIEVWHAALSMDTCITYGWNILYDIAVIHRWCPELRDDIYAAMDAGRIVDAALLEQLIDMRSGEFVNDEKCKFVYDDIEEKTRRVGYGLIEAEWYYKCPDLKIHNKKGPNAWRLRYGELRHVPVDEWPDDAVLYAVLDVTGLRWVVQEQLKSLDLGLRSDFSLYHRAAEETTKGVGLTLQSCKSFRTDPARTKKLTYELHLLRDKALESLQKPMHEEGKCPTPGRPTCPGCRLLMKPQKGHEGRFLCKPCGRTGGGACTHRLVDPPRTKASGPNKGEMTEMHANTSLLRDTVEYLCTHYSLEIPRTETGLVAVGAKELLKISAFLEARALETGEELDPLAKPLARQVDYSRASKLINTYLDILPLGFDTGIKYSVTPLLGTGRCSVEQPPLQQLPRKGGIRECLIPEEGYRLISCDYSTLELRTLAQSCIWIVGWSTLADALNAGLDPHLDLAAQIMGISYEVALMRYNAGDKEVDEWRQLAKIANFGFPGGLQPDTFVEYALQYDRIVGVQQARTLYENWKRKWPEVVPFFAHIKRLTGHSKWGGTVTLGAPPDTDVFDGLTRGRLNFTAAANYNFQGPAARGAKWANYLVVRACYHDKESPLYGLADSLLFAHDEILLQCVDDDVVATVIAREVQRLMIEAMSKFIPDIVILAEPVCMLRWIKGAKPTWLNGYLTNTPEKEKKAA